MSLSRLESTFILVLNCFFVIEFLRMVSSVVKVRNMTDLFIQPFK